MVSRTRGKLFLRAGEAKESVRLCIEKMQGNGLVSLSFSLIDIKIFETNFFVPEFSFP